MRKTIGLILLCLVLGWTTATSAAVHRLRVPLENGRLTLATFAQSLTDLLHLPELDVPSGASINLRGFAGSFYITALRQSLGEGCRVHIDGDALVLEVDPEKLPGTSRQVKEAIRLFTALAAPEATQRQARGYGLELPSPLDAHKRLVVLVHGMDCDGSDWAAMARLLQSDEYQVAYFRYPNDEALSQSVTRFAQAMRALRADHPRLVADVVTHSMGAMLARGYIEGNAYAGGVHHLILIAPPNHGSSWAMLRPLLEWREHYELWRHNPDWHWTWMITDGLGVAGEDLEPDSDFLKYLNGLKRRRGVRYTIIAGTRTPWQRLGAEGLDRVDQWVPGPLRSVWGIRQWRNRMVQWSEELRNHDAGSDGVVSLQSAVLPGVSDVVTLPVDHQRLYVGTPDRQPAAWATVQSRLAQ